MNDKELLEQALAALKGADQIDVDMQNAISAIEAAITQPAHNDHGRHWDRTCPACNESIDYEPATSAQLEGDAKDARVKVLEDALKPFAALLQDHNDQGPDSKPIFAINGAMLTLGDLRRAALNQSPKE